MVVCCVHVVWLARQGACWQQLQYFCRPPYTHGFSLSCTTKPAGQQAGSACHIHTPTLFLMKTALQCHACCSKARALRPHTFPPRGVHKMHNSINAQTSARTVLCNDLNNCCFRQTAPAADPGVNAVAASSVADGSTAGGMSAMAAAWKAAMAASTTTALSSAAAGPTASVLTAAGVPPPPLLAATFPAAAAAAAAAESAAARTPEAWLVLLLMQAAESCSADASCSSSSTLSCTDF